jgi:hypothetical protein
MILRHFVTSQPTLCLWACLTAHDASGHISRRFDFGQSFVCFVLLVVDPSVRGYAHLACRCIARGGDAIGHCVECLITNCFARRSYWQIITLTRDHVGSCVFHIDLWFANRAHEPWACRYYGIGDSDAHITSDIRTVVNANLCIPTVFWFARSLSCP